jgi:hypothetical protein
MIGPGWRFLTMLMITWDDDDHDDADDDFVCITAGISSFHLSIFIFVLAISEMI